MDKVVLIGHPYTPIGRGEDIRCTFRALSSIGHTPKVLDLYGLSVPEGPVQNQISAQQTKSLGRVNVFHLNGNEIEQALNHLKGVETRDFFNIAYPQWELSRYPQAWAKQLDRFNEIWAPTKFIFDALKPVVSVPLKIVSVACEVELSEYLGRKYFDVLESPYTFLFFFDFRSFWQRKNPDAVVAAFEKLVKRLPNSDVALVIKVNGAEQAPEALTKLVEKIAHLSKKVKLINRTMTDNEIKNLVRVSDCFISLHRSEGFGRGLSEAMFLGKPVIATRYSGNVDFMSGTDSLLVDYQLIPVAAGEYPAWENQVWADADVDHATFHMENLVKNPSSGTLLGRKAISAIRRRVGYRRTGLDFHSILEKIEA